MKNNLKIAIASDLHLEFGDIELKNEQGADLLILAGDICVAEDMDFTLRADQREVDGDEDGARSMRHATKYYKGLRYIDFFNRVAEEFPQVIYVMGNHEHYSGDFQTTTYVLRQFLPDNVKLLDKSYIEVGGVIVFGATFWTDMNRGDPITLLRLRDAMNDYSQIVNSATMVQHKYPKPDGSSGWIFKSKPARFIPEDALKDHEHTLQALAELLSDTDKPVIVVSHHAPSFESVHQRFQHEVIVNGGYASELSYWLDEFVNQPVLWVHGHMHHRNDYMMGPTRVVSNPRGYIGFERAASGFQLVYVEVGVEKDEARTQS